MLDEHGREANRFVAELASNQVAARVRSIAFVEEQVDGVQHGIEARQIFIGPEFEPHVGVAKLTLGTNEPLRDRIIARQESPRDFRHAEAAHGLERERNPCLAREDRMACEEHHRELIVVGQRRLAAELDVRVRRLRNGVERRQHGRAVGEPLLAPKHIERAMLGDLDEPRGRIRRHAFDRPELQRLDERVLRHFFGEREVPCAENPRQRRDDLPRCASEQIVEQLVHVRMISISRTSMLPKSRCGQSFTVAIAAS